MLGAIYGYAARGAHGSIEEIGSVLEGHSAVQAGVSRAVSLGCASGLPCRFGLGQGADAEEEHEWDGAAARYPPTEAQLDGAGYSGAIVG